MTQRSIYIAGHKTSLNLEDAFWEGLKEIATERDATLSELVTSIDADRRHTNLSSTIRLFVLDHYRSRIDATADESKPGALGKRASNPAGGLTRSQ
jgi:predicted DNA-binding ribbon-helix-helix protein